MNLTPQLFFIIAFANLALRSTGGFALDQDTDPNFQSVADEIKQTCKKAKILKVPPEDQPDEPLSKTLSHCDAEALYYGFSAPADAVKARECAIVKDDSTVLTMVYANGKGSKQNLDLAIHFACEMGGAPAEISGRVQHLVEIRESKNTNPNFDYCDDITSGMMQGVCTAKAERFAEAKRNAEFGALTAKWTNGEKSAFAKLEKASQEFTNARIENEVDLSGSARAAFMIEEESIQKKDFIESLQKLENGKAPRYTSAQYKKEDRKLNELYNQTQIRTDDTSTSGTVTKDKIKTAQKAWINYRNAWVEFTKVKFPHYPSDSIAAWFTKKRNHMLNSLLRP